MTRVHQGNRKNSWLNERTPRDRVNVLRNWYLTARVGGEIKTRTVNDAREQVKEPRISFSGEFHERGRTGYQRRKDVAPAVKV